MDPLWELEQASVELEGRHILRGVSLQLQPGEAIALVGPSGAGKTTLLRLLNGTLRCSAGRARFEGEDLASLNRPRLQAARARIGFIHQDHALVPSLRVSQNLAAGRLGGSSLLGGLRRVFFPAAEERQEMYKLLERVGIAEHLFGRASRLSGGEKQRLAVARALYQEPVALLADEPVASVDPVRARALVDLLRRLAEEEQMALVCSLHDLELAKEFFPRTIGLRSGEIVFDCPTNEVEEGDLSALYELEPS